MDFASVGAAHALKRPPPRVPKWKRAGEMQDALA